MGGAEADRLAAVVAVGRRAAGLERRRTGRRALLYRAGPVQHHGHHRGQLPVPAIRRARRLATTAHAVDSGGQYQGAGGAGPCALCAVGEGGHLRATPGDVVDYGLVADELAALCQRYEVVHFFCDPWRLEYLKQLLPADIQAKFVEIPQTMAGMSCGMGEIERMMRTG